jgi:hypothetical protein
VNIDRDLYFGRGYNTFGEDPLPDFSAMGVAEVKGIQSQHVMAQMKHFVGYDSDERQYRTSTTKLCMKFMWRRSKPPFAGRMFRRLCARITT